MYYLLVFVGLVGMAIIVAVSPLVIRLLEYLFPVSESAGSPFRPAIGSGLQQITPEAARMPRQGSGNYASVNQN